ncbi:hypothetical protein, partial [Mycobacterium kansasii]|uniref:hypothetical protein n=1 Tax=Mycobacterium kansasii TaxID=1768 RepID=UPI001156D3B6
MIIPVGILVVSTTGSILFRRLRRGGVLRVRLRSLRLGRWLLGLGLFGFGVCRFGVCGICRFGVCGLRLGLFGFNLRGFNLRGLRIRGFNLRSFSLADLSLGSFSLRRLSFVSGVGGSCFRLFDFGLFRLGFGHGWHSKLWLPDVRFAFSLCGLSLVGCRLGLRLVDNDLRFFGSSFVDLRLLGRRLRLDLGHFGVFGLSRLSLGHFGFFSLCRLSLG